MDEREAQEPLPGVEFSTDFDEVPSQDPLTMARGIAASLGENIAQEGVKYAFRQEVIEAALMLKREDPGVFEEMVFEVKRKKITLKTWRDELRKRDVASRKNAAGKRELDDRVRIRVDTDEIRVNDETVKALVSCDDIYQRSERLVHVVRAEAATEERRKDRVMHSEGSPMIRELSSAALRERCSSVASYYEVREKQTEDGGTKIVERTVHIPGWCYLAVADRGEWPGIRKLSGVIEHPVFRQDGSILNTPGYDEATSLLYVPSEAFLEVPLNPTREDALAALEQLLDPVCQFPFKGEEHRSAWLAAVLTPFATYAYDGPSPLVLVDANVRGTGKTTLCDIINGIISGRPMARVGYTQNDEEMSKAITSLAMEGASNVLLDNIDGRFGGASLDRALTGTIWKGRMLGHSEMSEIEFRPLWLATGNNVQFAADTARRCLHVRLETSEENPENRNGYKHSNVLGFVKKNRPALVRAALTILRAWFCAGQPQASIKRWGTFEAWSGIVRNAIVWLGMKDPYEGQAELQAESDTSHDALANLIEGWAEISAKLGGSCTVVQALNELERNDSASYGQHAVEPKRYESLRAAIGELCGPRASSKQLSYQIRHYRGRVVAGRCIAKVGRRNDGHAWRVVQVGECTSDASADREASVDAPRVGSTPSALHESESAHVHAESRRNVASAREESVDGVQSEGSTLDVHTPSTLNTEAVFQRDSLFSVDGVDTFEPNARENRKNSLDGDSENFSNLEVERGETSTRSTPSTLRRVLTHRVDECGPVQCSDEDDMWDEGRE